MSEIDIEALRMALYYPAAQTIMEGPFFDVCKIRGHPRFRYANTTKREGEIVSLLRAVHCKSWDEIPKPVIDALPVLIEELIGVPIPPRKASPWDRLIRWAFG